MTVAKVISDFERTIKLQKKQGAIEKLHNLIWFICALFQFKQLFIDLAKVVFCI